MIVKKTTLRFEPSTSPDVTGYMLYIEEAPTPVDYDSEAVDLGDRQEIDLSTLQLNTKDGVYNLGIAAYDEVGNLSSLSIIENVALDFVAPDPPTGLTVLRETPIEPVELTDQVTIADQIGPEPEG